MTSLLSVLDRGVQLHGILLARSVRGFADGLVSMLLAGHLARLGFSSAQIGVIVGGTLLGSAGLTIVVGLLAHRLDPRRILLGAAVLMIVTGIAFAITDAFWPLLLVAVLGTLNPSAGDMTLFLPTEQTLMASWTSPQTRTRAFAWYNLCGAFTGAVGALASGWWSHLPRAEPALFLLYAACGVVVFGLYARLPAVPRPPPGTPRAALARSRPIVLRLTALFTLDAFAGGFVVQTLLVLWLSRRFHLPTDTTAVVFFVVGLCGALSQLVSARLAARFGLIQTMVYTHLPANLLLIIAGVMPHAGLAVGCLLARALLSQMDVPARQAYVMAVVPPEERAAAASVTAVPRSLATAVPPLFVGWLLDHSTFGWPLICAGILKAVYDVLLLVQFRDHPTQPG